MHHLWEIGTNLELCWERYEGYNVRMDVNLVLCAVLPGQRYVDFF